MATQEIGFDTAIYSEAQHAGLIERLSSDVPNIIEFGGKPFGDYHAARVLPGYNPDIKADFIKGIDSELGGVAMIIAVNAQDILAMPDGRRIARRIRGDSDLTYDDEVLRLADQADKEFGIGIGKVVLTVVPVNLSSRNSDYLEAYRERLTTYFDEVHVLPKIEGYPGEVEPSQLIEQLTSQPPIVDKDEGLMVLSPGGGSGKFSVALAETAKKLTRGVVPNFVKFETFPVFHLPVTHPLNSAFLAATADLKNELQIVKNGDTNYDKDDQNLRILRNLLDQFPELDTGRLEFQQPTEMGVNLIEAGITSLDVVTRACHSEIERRIKRYKREIYDGNETEETLERTLRCVEGF